MIINIMYYNILLIPYILFNTTCWITSIYCTDKKTLYANKEALPLVFLNVIIIAFPVFILFSNCFEIDNYDIISCCKQLLLLYIFSDLVFYIMHYIFHSKYLYKYHQVHHHYKDPVAITTFYAHPIDFVCTNILPFVILGIIIGAHFITMNIWIVITTFNGIYISHANMTNNKFHIKHHKNVIYNYGLGMYMDKILSTNIN
jgi:sterol desaturase/sphingolipid hydroxylase (fatty acid hydroxylase superfamily)